MIENLPLGKLESAAILADWVPTEAVWLLSWIAAAAVAGLLLRNTRKTTPANDQFVNWKGKFLLKEQVKQRLKHITSLRTQLSRDDRAFLDAYTAWSFGFNDPDIDSAVERRRVVMSRLAKKRSTLI